MYYFAKIRKLRPSGEIYDYKFILKNFEIAFFK